MSLQFINSIFFLLCIAISVNSSAPDPACFQIRTSKRANDCCLIPNFYDAQQMADCLPSMGKSIDLAGKQNCLVECIAKKLKLYKGKKLDKSAARDYFNLKIEADPNFTPIIGNMFDVCYSQVSTAPTNPAKCSSLPMELLNCLLTKLFLNCPTGVWQGGSECNELKDKLSGGCPYYAIA